MSVNVIPEVINDMRVYLDGADDMIGCKIKRRTRGIDSRRGRHWYCWENRSTN